MGTLRPVGRVLLRDTAYAAIRDAIVQGELPPGEPVRDADLAERLGLSRAPVREALARLAEEGLVETKPQSWTRVTRLEPRAVREAAVVVRAMHELAARAAVPRLTDEDVAAMRRANARFEEATRAGETGAALAADDELHDVLVRVADNRAVAATIARHTPLIRRLEWRRFAEESALESAALHELLIASCAARDAVAAARVTARIWRALEELADEPEPESGAGEPGAELEPRPESGAAGPGAEPEPRPRSGVVSALEPEGLT
ncbi:GntR family transcriptional regulator [Streptomyces sp. NPDC057638]|uniref:GntR family transcriptional regulator n=1 Tax=Streptomyces sp. NPDC057638 TaxID=3346190 RepID=UPI0036934E96